MDPVREAFQKIKQDIDSIKQDLQELRQKLQQIIPQTSEKQQFTTKIIQTTPTHIQTNTLQQTDKQTHNLPLEPRINQNTPFSIGNGGVPTDRQTNQQTDKIHINEPFPTKSDDFDKARQILDSLDSIKKEIRLKFKRLTPQEMLIFSTLYSLKEQNIQEIDYKTLANQLNLSESSIRDYIIKLTKKGIPIQKTRQNNKKITLSISESLRKTATLSTIIQLRDL